MKENIKKYIAEAVGSCLLIFFGCGAAIFCYSTMGALGIALVFACTYLLCYYTIGVISGCHLNPVFSFVSFLTKRIDFRQFLFYILFQFIGSIVAVLLLLLIVFMCSGAYEVLSNFHACNGYDIYSPMVINVFGAIVVEIVITAIFVFAFMYMTFRKDVKWYAGLFIAAVYFLLVLFAFDITGACLNPIRALAPALIAFSFGIAIPFLQFFVFLLSTFIGSVLAALLYRAYFKDECGDFIISLLNFGK